METRKQLLVRALQDSDENIRTLAAESLERLEIRGRLAFLEKVFETGDKMAKLRAVYALSNLRGGAGRKYFVKGLEGRDRGRARRGNKGDREHSGQGSLA